MDETLTPQNQDCSFASLAYAIYLRVASCGEETPRLSMSLLHEGNNLEVAVCRTFRPIEPIIYAGNLG